MKSQRIFLLCIALIFLAEIAGLLAFAAQTPEASQDTVAVNEAVQELTADWDHLESHEKHGTLDYVALDADGTVLYRTQEGLSESINAAVAHRDTILDIKKDGVLVGKAIIFHSEAGAAAKRTQTLLALLAAALEELRQLTVSPVSLPSTELQAMLTNSDYRNLAELSPVPECFIEADPLRLQQVFDNIFSNAYKYAGTKMRVDLRKTKSFLEIAVQDFGDGVPAKELPMLKEKFRRGSNAANKDGAGLGLYLSDYFMKEMGGDLLLENGTPGLRATVCVRLSGSLS